MAKQVYEISWLVVTDVLETVRSEWERAEDGYYSRFLMARPVKEIDGYRVVLEQKTVTG